MVNLHENVDKDHQYHIESFKSIVRPLDSQNIVSYDHESDSNDKNAQWRNLADIVLVIVISNKSHPDKERGHRHDHISIKNDLQIKEDACTVPILLLYEDYLPEDKPIKKFFRLASDLIQ